MFSAKIHILDPEPYRDSSTRIFLNWDYGEIDKVLLMCQNHFLNFYNLPLICYNI